MIEVFLDPDGTHALGHYVLVAAATGVRYETQCAGLATFTKSAEGFLVSVGPQDQAKAAMSWIAAKAKGRESDSLATWSSEDIEQLDAMLQKLIVWNRSSDGTDVPVNLELDRERLGDCFEAWVAVRTPYGEGFLLGKNSD